MVDINVLEIIVRRILKFNRLYIFINFSHKTRSVPKLECNILIFNIFSLNEDLFKISNKNYHKNSKINYLRR